MTTQDVQNSPGREEISIRAYQIYLERGCPAGGALAHWLQAEAELLRPTAPRLAEPPRAPGARRLPLGLRLIP